MKQIKKPTISVLIPVFNSSRDLPTALDSILNQSYKNFEVIAIDDGSTDNSYKILKNYALGDKRLRVFKNSKNQNIARTLNRAVKLARGQFLARMDADDIATPDRLKIQLEYLKKHADTVVVGGQCVTIDQDDNLLGTKKFPTTEAKIKSTWFLINPMQHPTMMINRNLLSKHFNWYNPELPPAEDLDLLYRLAKYGKVANLDKFVLFYRLHLTSETFKNPKKTFEVTKKVRNLAKNQYGYRESFVHQTLGLLQEIAIKTLPGSFIYFIYNTVRNIMPVKIPKKTLAFMSELQTASVS